MEPQLVKLSKNLPENEKQNYIELFKEFKDVFAWKYEYLKTYDMAIIQHKIPLKPGTYLLFRNSYKSIPSYYL